MKPLDRDLRNRLERTVQRARATAEEAARAALDQLGVGEGAPAPHLSDDERSLRRRLRAHGRSLGDVRDEKTTTQETVRLIEEVAYEHWHRMLFARFLAENNLLMYPDPDQPVPVSLEDCAELAADEGAANGWELAARYAARMLPQIFRVDSPVFELSLPPENQQRLEKLVADLPTDVFTASDSLGWVYQFWQAQRKDEVNASEVKIGARELPAVTQLFTEPYMVSFLLDNSLGAWWAARRLSPDDLRNATSEEELRRKAAIPGVPLEYLRFVREISNVKFQVSNGGVGSREGSLDVGLDIDEAGNDQAGVWTPAAGTFEAWPESLADFRTLDPCCGSGHFLVATFLTLVPMRMELEGLTAAEATDAVLRQNLHGLEIDPRCVALAAFALALSAWTYPGAGGYRPLPELHLACSGLSVRSAREEWKELGTGNQNLRLAMDWLHETFSDAPVLGSLINPARTNVAKLADISWEEITATLQRALTQASDETDERHEAAVTAQGLARAATLLAGSYHLVITNVPYLNRGKQSETLRTFCERYYPEAKNDLATVFLDRCLEFCEPGGTCSIVLPQNWLFLTSYRKFREKLLKNETWQMVARLGAQAFQTPMWDFNVQLLTLTHGNTATSGDELFSNTGGAHLLRGVDVSEPRTAAEKSAMLVVEEVKSVEQGRQVENPDARIGLSDSKDLVRLEVYGSFHNGLQTGDYQRFSVGFWEVSPTGKDWSLYQSTVPSSSLFGGCDKLVFWQEGNGEINNSSSSVIRGTGAWGNRGISISATGRLSATLYCGNLFDENTVSIIPDKVDHLTPLWAFCHSPEYHNAVREINQSLKVRGDLVKVPFDLDRWQKVADEKFPNGLPKPYSDDPTQWLFHGHPCGSVVWDEEEKWTAEGPLRTDETVLQVAVARLLGYRWPAEFDPEMELADEQRAWVERCEALLPFADRDGIVPIPPVRGEASAADRLHNLLAAAYGDAWSNEMRAALLKSAGHAGKSLESWLREKFFAQHIRLFQNRPFIWHIWDGLRDGFAALVNYHKLDRKNLETLIYTYVGDWITRQKQEIANGVDGAEEKLAAAERLKKSLELILEGEAPYDIFVRWKHLAEQPIGWDPDLNDGVRMNIRPFMSVPDVGKKGAGLLKEKPNIKWTKDRGRDVESAPWYHLGPEYGGREGDRVNEHHLGLGEKRGARG